MSSNSTNVGTWTSGCLVLSPRTPGSPTCSPRALKTKPRGPQNASFAIETAWAPGWVWGCLGTKALMAVRAPCLSAPAVHGALRFSCVVGVRPGAHVMHNSTPWRLLRFHDATAAASNFLTPPLVSHPAPPHVYVSPFRGVNPVSSQVSHMTLLRFIRISCRS